MRIRIRIRSDPLIFGLPDPDPLLFFLLVDCCYYNLNIFFHFELRSDPEPEPDPILIPAKFSHSELDRPLDLGMVGGGGPFSNPVTKTKYTPWNRFFTPGILWASKSSFFGAKNTGLHPNRNGKIRGPYRPRHAN